MDQSEFFVAGATKNSNALVTVKSAVSFLPAFPPVSSHLFLLAPVSLRCERMLSTNQKRTACSLTSTLYGVINFLCGPQRKHLSSKRHCHGFYGRGWGGSATPGPKREKQKQAKKKPVVDRIKLQFGIKVAFFSNHARKVTVTLCKWKSERGRIGEKEVPLL